MTWYRLVIEEIKDAEVITSYTRWVDAVQVKGVENQEIYLTFSPRFEHIWLKRGNVSCSMVRPRPARPNGNVSLLQG
jgi:hypothetical protein